MRIGIHHREMSFSHRWIEKCEEGHCTASGGPCDEDEDCTYGPPGGNCPRAKVGNCINDQGRPCETDEECCDEPPCPDGLCVTQECRGGEGDVLELRAVADLQKDVRGAGVLADRAVADGGHARVDQDGVHVGFEGQPINDHDELLSYLTGEIVGNAAEVEVIRGGQRTTVQVTVVVPTG